jgi:hypothetical protein
MGGGMGGSMGGGMGGGNNLNSQAQDPFNIRGGQGNKKMDEFQDLFAFADQKI